MVCRIRQTRGVMNQMRLKRERNENLRKMLMAHMPYVYNCYKLEEVESVSVWSCFLSLSFSSSYSPAQLRFCLTMNLFLACACRNAGNCSF